MLTATELKQHVAAKGLTLTSAEDSDSASLETDDDSRTSADDDDIESGRYGRTAAAPRRQQLGRTHPRGHLPRKLRSQSLLSRGSVQVQRQAALGQDCSVAVLPDKGSRASLCPHGQVCAGVC